MSKISELRADPKNNISITRLVEKMLPNKKTKYIEMLVRILREHFENGQVEYEYDLDKRYNTEGLNNMEILFWNYLFGCIMSHAKIDDINYFCDKCENNVIRGIDFQKVTLDEIETVIAEHKNSDKEKLLQSQVLRLLDDDEWLILLPFTYEASKKYGANTKWCTASSETDDAFLNYTTNGSLIYIINKKTNTKNAIYYELTGNNLDRGDFCLYNEEDRFIQLIFSDLPESVLMVIRDFLINNRRTNQVLYNNFIEKDLEDEPEEDAFFDINDKDEDPFPSEEKDTYTEKEDQDYYDKLFEQIKTKDLEDIKTEDLIDFSKFGAFGSYASTLFK